MNIKGALLVVLAVAVAVRATTEVIFSDPDEVYAVTYSYSSKSVVARYEVFDWFFADAKPIVGYSLKFYPQVGKLLYLTEFCLVLVDPASDTTNFFGEPDIYVVIPDRALSLTGHISFDEKQSVFYLGAQHIPTKQLRILEYKFGLNVNATFGTEVGLVAPYSPYTTCKSMEYDPQSKFFYMCADGNSTTLMRSNDRQNWQSIGPPLANSQYPTYLTRDSLATPNTIYVSSSLTSAIYRITADTGELQLCLTLVNFQFDIIEYFAVDAKNGVFFLFLRTFNGQFGLFKAEWDSPDSCITTYIATNLTAAYQGSFAGITLRHTLDPGEIAGIVLGSLVFVALVISGIIFYCKFGRIQPEEPRQRTNGVVLQLSRPTPVSHTAVYLPDSPSSAATASSMPEPDAAKLRNINNFDGPKKAHLKSSSSDSSSSSEKAPTISKKLSAKPSRTVLYKVDPSFNLPQMAPNLKTSHRGGDGHDVLEVEEAEGQGAECVVCLDKPRDSIVIPCGHICLCHQCAELLETGNKVCPICRSPAEGIYKVFKA